MKLLFLGSGSAFALGQNYHSNILLINEHNKCFLIDCGTDIRFSISEVGLSYSDLGSVYISHLHADHAGGLEWLGFTTKFDPACPKPNLYISENLIESLWETVLKGGLSSLSVEKADLSTYFTLKPIGEVGSFIWEGINFQLVQTIHMISNFLIVPSYGLFFTINNIKIFITTDTQFCFSRYIEIYRLADVIFHDCEINPRRSGVHAHYTDLLTLDPNIKGKMWLYHYDNSILPDAKKDGFKGFVSKGQCFDFDNLKTR